LALVTFTAGGASAVTFAASAAFTAAEQDQDGVLPAGWPSYVEARDCIRQGQCEHLEDVAFAHVDISAEMQHYTDIAYYEVSNGLVSTTTLWMVCSYDGQATLLDCWYDDRRSWGMSGELSQEARELRLFPIQSAPNEYHFSLYVA
jgi:hypothetical protein